MHLRLSFSRAVATTVALPFALTFLFGTGPTMFETARAQGHPERLPARRVTPDEYRTTENGRRVLEREERRARVGAARWESVHQLLGPQLVSRKSHELLKQRGLGPELGADGWVPKAAGTLQITETDTLRILLVRIAFETNRRPDLTTVPPDGNFDLSTAVPPADGSFLADPPPHAKAYFESHLTGLTEYYRFQSGGRLYIDSAVLPTGDTDAYRLGDVADYGPGESGFWTLDGLESFTRDMIRAADAGMLTDDPFGDGSTLADFDDDDPFTYVIFVHAGSDWQSDINGDSPNDPPTFFVALGEPEILASTDSETGENGALSECSVIPETTSQDGFQGSIAAGLYHEFGHALGLVDVYSTYSGIPQVGVWDLMDSGTNLAATVTTVHPETEEFVFTPVVGLIPPSLGAWNKWFLGWAVVAEVGGGETEYRLPAVQVLRDDYGLYTNFNLAYPQLLWAGASARERFLLENRWVPVSADETPFDAFFFQSDPATGVILYLGGELNGQDVNSGMYDFFMPGGGLLVWQVNRDRIENGLADNSVNRYGDGLRLLEADGIQDIGVIDAYVLGWLGSARDPFGGYDAAGNTNDYNELYPQGIPSSRAHDRSWTGFGLRDVRTTGSNYRGVMVFDARIEPLVGNYPFTVAAVGESEAAEGGGAAGPRGVEPAALVALPTDGEPAVGFVGRAPRGWTGDPWGAVVFALDAAGAPRFGTLADLPPGGIVRLAGPLIGPPVLLAEEPPVVVFGTQTGHVHGLPAASGDVAPTWAWTTSVADSLAWGPTPGGSSWLLLPISPDELLLIDRDGQLVGDPLALQEPGGVVPNRLAGAPRAAPTVEGPGWVVPADRGWFRVAADRSGLEQNPSFHAYPAVPADSVGVVTARIPDPAGDVLLVFAGTAPVGMWRLAADGVEGPWEWPVGLDEALVAEPAVADVDGNGRDDVVLLTRNRVFAAQADGAALSGFPVRLNELFPLPDSIRVAGPAVVCDTDGDRANEIHFATSGGHLVGLSADGRLLDRTPFLWGDSGVSGLAVGPWTTATGRRLLWLLSDGGYTGPPLDRQLYGGRVLAYALPGGVAPAGGTSEWLAAQGGFAREGPVGAPSALGDAAPLAAYADAPLVYPNPLRDRQLTVRFYSTAGATAEFALYNLEGEEVLREDLPAVAGQMNEYPVSLPDLASGLYLCRLVHDARGSRETTVITLAVER